MGLLIGLLRQTQPSGTNLRPFKSGLYYAPVQSVSEGTMTLTDGLGWATAFLVGARTTFDRIGLEVTTSHATAAMRLGIYSGSTGIPAALVLDAGTVAVATTGAKEITISQALDAGVYWLVAAAQGGNIGVRARSVASTYMGTATIGNENQSSFRISAAGALPDPFVIVDRQNESPKIMLRAA